METILDENSAEILTISGRRNPDHTYDVSSYGSKVGRIGCTDGHGDPGTLMLWYFISEDNIHYFDDDVGRHPCRESLLDAMYDFLWKRQWSRQR